MLKCEECGLESSYLDEVSYYDINENNHCDEQDIENNLQNTDALAHQLCSECAENFVFDYPKILGCLKSKFYEKEK